MVHHKYGADNREEKEYSFHNAPRILFSLIIIASDVPAEMPNYEWNYKAVIIKLSTTLSILYAYLYKKQGFFLSLIKEKTVMQLMMNRIKEPLNDRCCEQVPLCVSIEVKTSIPYYERPTARHRLLRFCL
jgi:hypothetical protein